MGNGNGDTFGYAEFGNWYDAYRADTLEPALDRAMDALQRELDDALSDRDLARIRSISGRVKSKRRTWRKVNQPHYRRQITTVDDIPARHRRPHRHPPHLHQPARPRDGPGRAREPAAARRQSGARSASTPTSERDYVEQPKESGYRGWHVNLGVQHDGAPVTCELQVRTLLQDSWGELTHEDTYSKSGELPPLVEVLSTRMADLLATLDDIAEDLRNELDRIDEAIVAETAGQLRRPTRATTRPELTVGPGADAADLLLERWRSLDRPLEFSSLAWALQNEFGAEVSDDWFGYRTFKRFLRAAVPEGEISGDRQLYLLPPARRDWRGRHRSTTPVATDSAGATTVRRIDRSPTKPANSAGSTAASRWSRPNSGGASTSTSRRRGVASARAPRRPGWSTSSPARPATGLAPTGDPLTRRHLDHVAKAVLATSGSGEPLDADQIGDAFASSVLQRMADLRIVAADDAASRARIGRWLLG